MATRLDDLISPYNFVPTPDVRVWPDWAGHISHDRPFHDGISGTLDIEINADTAIFIGGGPIEGTDRPVETFYRDARGDFAVPGTSLRGMLRSVVEIASFGRLGPFNDLKLGFRDLQHRDYTNAMNGNVNAGWLVRDDKGWTIEACHYAKVDYDVIGPLGGRGFVPGKKQGADEKYATFGGSLDQRFGLRRPAGKAARSINPDGAVPIVSEYMEVDQRAPGATPGTIVLTGQPMDRLRNEPRRKHSDFFFFGNAGFSFKLDAQQRKDFEFIHSDGKQQGKDSLEPAPEWKFWEKKVDSATGRPVRVPVFFLLDRNPDTRERRVRAFGLAGMFRLAADQRISDVVRNAQGDARQWPDFAEAMFGYVSDGKTPDGAPDGALRGRVSIGLARATTANPAEQPVEAVFGVPKPSFYPYYLQHGRRPSFDGRPEEERLNNGRTKLKWHTYMSKDATARGWKRYVIRKRADSKPFLPHKVQEKHLSRFVPLKPGATFTARVRVHNLRPMELGALIWALDFGGSDTARHRLGRGRPLGFGAVKVRATGHRLQRLASDEAVTLDGLRDDFTGYMQGQTAGKWARSRTIFELQRLAQPLDDAASNRVDYPRLDPNGRMNQFNDIKKFGPGLKPHGGSDAHQAWSGADAANASVEATWPEGTAWTPPSRTFESSAKAVDSTQDTPIQPQGQPKPSKPIEKPAPAPLLTEGWIEAGFANILQARERRKQVAKDRTKKKVKARLIGLRLADDRVTEVDAASLAGMSEVFDVLANNGGVAFEFHVRLKAGAIVEVALTPPAT